jgi:hypothetical protein
MNFSQIGRYTLSACMAFALLAACASAQLGTPGAGANGGESGFTPLSVSRLAALTIPNYVARPVHPDRGQSWMRPDKLIPKLLYVSDWTTDDVYVLAFPNAVIVGKLTGFDEPYGQCVDATGNIWVTNFAASTVVEYAHGAKKPKQTLTTDGSPIGCSVSAKGKLAVANFSTASGGGDIQVFIGETGTPTDYTNSKCGNLWSPGYDLQGNLFVEGEASSKFALCEISYRGTVLKTATINQTINMAGSAMWDGKYMTVTDQEGDGIQTPVIYQANVSSSGLTVEGNTQLTDTCDGQYVDVPQPYIVSYGSNTPVNKKQGTIVVGGNLLCKKRYDYWAYPWPSGDPLESIKKSPEQPYGESFSVVPAKK